MGRQAQYIKRDIYRVAGYMVSLDAELFDSLIAAQAAQGITGSLAEIGVHHGRSFILMAMHRRPGERSLAIDLFEDDDMYSDVDGLGRDGNFRRNCDRFGVALAPEEVLTGSSLDLAPDDVTTRVGPVRFFSIDGGHGYEHVENDLALAQQTVLDAGIIVVDDFASTFWPEVTFATYDWLRGPGDDFAPFAATQSKLYLSRRHHHARYRDRSPPIPACGGGSGPRGPASATASSISIAPRLKGKDGLLRRALGTERAAPRPNPRLLQRVTGR